MYRIQNLFVMPRQAKQKTNKNKPITINSIDCASALTAYVIYSLVGITFKTTKNNDQINLMFKQIQTQIKQDHLPCTFNLSDYSIQSLYHNRGLGRRGSRECARNIYENICDNHSLFMKFKHTFSILDQKVKFMNLKGMVGLKTFESSHTTCIMCDQELKRITKNCGSICVSYGQLEGAQPGISYQKKCKGCNIKYFYGKYITKNTTFYEPLKQLEYFELTPYTYMRKDIFITLKFHLFQTSRGFENYVDQFNLMHHESMDAIAERLKEIGQTLGIRTGQTDPVLEPNRMIEAFFLYTLLDSLQSEKVHIQLTNAERNKILKNKNERIELHRQNSQSQSDFDQSISNVDLFEYWFDKYTDMIKQIDSKILNHVPVNKITGEILIGHFICMMDGNAKNIRKICGYTEEDQLRGIFIVLNFSNRFVKNLVIIILKFIIYIHI